MSPAADVVRVVPNEIGQSGLVRFAGIVQESPYAKNLSWIEQVKIYSEMAENEPTIGAGLLAIDAVSRQVVWYVEPFSTTPEDEANAAFVESCIDDMSNSWIDTISEVMTMMQFGWAFHEIVYKRRMGTVNSDPSTDTDGRNSKYNDGMIGWKYIPLRAQETLYKWAFDEQGGVAGMIQRAAPSYVETTIPMSRAMLFRTRNVKGNPQGRSILRNAYRPYYFKRQIEQVEGVGVERDLVGLPVAWADAAIMSQDATPEQKLLYQSIQAMVKSVRRDAVEGLVLPLSFDEHGNKLFQFELMNGGGTRQFDVGAIIGRKTNEIVMSMLTDFMLLGHESVGSFALSADKTTLFITAMGMMLDIIAAEFNKTAIPRLMYINGKDTVKCPKLRHRSVETVDLTALSVYVTSMATAGMLFPDEPMLDWVREIAEMPKRGDDSPKAGTPPPVPSIPQAAPAPPGAPGTGRSGTNDGVPAGGSVKPLTLTPTVKPHGLVKSADLFAWLEEQEGAA
jgi:hypothetical protein